MEYKPGRRFKESELFRLDTPLIFADGTERYKLLSKYYKQHDVGYFILGPSGVGKSHFINNQKEPNWLDGDDLWQVTNAHPWDRWWEKDLETINEVDAVSDVITMQAKRLGFWIIGTSNFWLKPDALVLPDWETHKGYIADRDSKTEAERTDIGGATSKMLDVVMGHRQWILEKHGKDVPQFKSVGEAASFLANKG